MTRAAAAALWPSRWCWRGLLFDTPSLLVPGVAIGLLAFGSALWVALAAHGAAIRRLPGPHTVEEEHPYSLRLELRPGLVPPPAGELHDPLLDEPVRLGAASPGRVRIDVRFERRGRRVLEPGRLSIHDPLRLAVRNLDQTGENEELLVLPRVEPVVATAAGGAAGGGTDPDGGGRAALRGRMDGSAAELDLDGLRPYRQGTPASRIHWPAVARSGEMLERRLTADGDSAPLVVLDASQPPSEESLDMAVRAAASLCLHWRGEAAARCCCRASVGLCSWPPTWRRGPPPHARLALVEGARTRPPLARARRAGAVMWVSARADAPRDLARAAVGGGWLVTPAVGPGQPGFTVAGCAGRRLGRVARASASGGRAAVGSGGAR